MAFCENCGKPLTPGVRFCELCGAKVDEKYLENEVPSTNASSSNIEIAESGIIYTNLEILSQQYVVSTEKITELLNSFIEAAAQRGVGYEICDVSSKVGGTGTVENHVEIIKEIVDKKHPKYLFIIGNAQVIPSITWENKAADNTSDPDFTSDLPYATLDINTPFNGQNYDFDEHLRVGRLPLSTFPQVYFENLKNTCGNIKIIKSFSLSATQWVEETREIYSVIYHGPEVMTSPSITISDVSDRIPSETNMFLFNLHGSRQTEFWYGQKDNSFPEAMQHDSLRKIPNPYFLAVEACYGAYYKNRTKSNSILLNSLENKCISFLGSSAIAFGAPRPKGSCADILCGKYLRYLCSGVSAGDALNKARKILMESSGNAETIKTLGEFALYGDPSARMTGRPKAEKGLFTKNENKSFSKGIRIPLPDVRRAVELELAIINERIAATVEEAVYKQYEMLRGVKPKYYKQKNTGKMSAVFEKDTQIGKKYVNVWFEGTGNIEEIIESK